MSAGEKIYTLNKFRPVMVGYGKNCRKKREMCSVDGISYLMILM